MSGAGDRIRRGQSSKAAEPFRRPRGRVSFPHRMTLDLEAGQYRWLRLEARESRVSASALIRAVLDELAERGTVDLQAARAAAAQAEAEDLPPE